MSDHREAIAEVLFALDFPNSADLAAQLWANLESDLLPKRLYLAKADALLGSDVLAQIRAEARAEALREAAEFIEVTAGIGTNDSTYADGWYAALGYALDELRDRAEGSA